MRAYYKRGRRNCSGGLSMRGRTASIPSHPRPPGYPYGRMPDDDDTCSPPLPLHPLIRAALLSPRSLLRHRRGGPRSDGEESGGTRSIGPYPAILDRPGLLTSLLIPAPASPPERHDVDDAGSGGLGGPRRRRKRRRPMPSPSSSPSAGGGGRVVVDHAEAASHLPDLALARLLTSLAGELSPASGGDGDGIGSDDGGTLSGGKNNNNNARPILLFVERVLRRRITDGGGSSVTGGEDWIPCIAFMMAYDVLFPPSSSSSSRQSPALSPSPGGCGAKKPSEPVDGGDDSKDGAEGRRGGEVIPGGSLQDEVTYAALRVIDLARRYPSQSHPSSSSSNSTTSPSSSHVLRRCFPRQLDRLDEVRTRPRRTEREDAVTTAAEAEDAEAVSTDPGRRSSGGNDDPPSSSDVDVVGSRTVPEPREVDDEVMQLLGWADDDDDDDGGSEGPGATTTNTVKRAEVGDERGDENHHPDVLVPSDGGADPPPAAGENDEDAGDEGAAEATSPLNAGGGGCGPTSSERPSDSSPIGGLPRDLASEILDLRSTLLLNPPSSSDEVKAAAESVVELLTRGGSELGADGVERVGTLLTYGAPPSPSSTSSADATGDCGDCGGDEGAPSSSVRKLAFTDVLLSAVHASFVTEGTSSTRAAAFVRSCMLPFCLDALGGDGVGEPGATKKQTRSRPASRVLVSTTSALARDRPVECVDHLLLPLMRGAGDSDAGVGGHGGGETGTGPTRSQCELVTRLVRGPLRNEHVSRLLAGMTTGGDRDDGGGVGAVAWTEDTVPVVAACLSKVRRTDVPPDVVTSICRNVERALSQPSSTTSSDDSPSTHEYQGRNVKFSAMFHSFVTKFGPEIKKLGHVDVLLGAAGNLKTFMAKPIRSSLEKLR